MDKLGLAKIIFGPLKPSETLKALEAIDGLLEDGYIEKFTNDEGETDFRLSTKYSVEELLKVIKND